MWTSVTLKRSKIHIILLLVLFLFVPRVYTRCGCHKMSEQGFLGHKPGRPGYKFEPLPHSIHSTGNGGAKYSVPNFRVLLFQPTFLDFQEQPVGMPYVQSVVLSNPSDQNDIEITAVNALPPFHSSRFTKKVLEPLANMTIDLVFLSTMVGNVEHTVYIYTSKGNFPYQLFGVGTPNLYRLRAFVSARIPLNGTFSPYINMYNPYNEPIQITEMYSSGSDLHLDLMGEAGNETVTKLWEIQPYETKAIMKATYHSKEEGLNIRFIRIVVGPPVPETETLILPFEILVSSKPGLYTNVDMLDFGMLRTMDESKSLNLNVLNLGNKTLQLLSVQVIPPNKAISVQFTPVALKPLKKYSKIATISYTAQLATHNRQGSGKIIVYTADDRKKLEIPYQANVLHGTVAYSVGKTSFYVGDSPKTQVLTITNTFNSTLVIYNVTLPAEALEVFSISNFSSAIMVPPGKLISPLSLKFKTNESLLSLSTVLRLYTNASIFTIPVHCYNGMLKYEVESLNDDVLDYGTVGVSENRTLVFKIINNNPVEISIKEIGTEFEYARLQLIHIKSLKKSKPKRIKVSQNSTLDSIKISSFKTKSKSRKGKENTDELVLKPSDVVTFAVDVHAPLKEGTYHGEILLKTIYQEIHIPIYLKTVKGKGSMVSKPKRIKIEKSFPGRTETYPISIESTFEYPIQLRNITVYPVDRRFTIVKPDFLPRIQAKDKVQVGWIKFDPYFGDPSQCYLCICELDPACDHWSQTLALPADTWEYDINLLEKLRKKWDLVETKQEASFNTSVIIDSSVIKGYTIPIQASLSWPSLVEQSIRFPPTHVGNYSSNDMVITNPSDHPIVVQVMPLLNYPQPDGGLDLLSEGLIMDSFSLDLNGQSQFFLPDIKNGWNDHYEVQTALNVYPSSHGLAMILAPRQKKVVHVGFIPDDEIPKTSIIVVRNNLTVLDLVVVHGQGARTYLNINGSPPGKKSSVLLFEIKAVHLKDCNKSTPKARLYPSFTVKRSFTATNKGSLPVQIVSLNINNYECEGFGFRILNCEPFVLKPNSSRKIDITFIPDFTTSRVSRTLSAVTSMGQSLDFVLLATLPHHLLPLCASALPRPFWEPYFHVVAAIIMSTIFIFIIFFAYFDAQKYVVQCTFTAGSASLKDMDVYTAGTVFDLNAIGLKVRITDNKKEKYTDTSKESSKTGGSTAKEDLAPEKPLEPTTTASQLRKRSSSDSSSVPSVSSRKSSSTQIPTQSLPEEKTELHKSKEETPPKKSKRKFETKNRQHRIPSYEELPEPFIEPVTEVIYDPYDREEMERFRQVRQQKLKQKQDSEDGDKQRRKKKNSQKKDSIQIHRTLQKEHSCGSSNADDDEQLEEKPSSLTNVKAKPKKRSETMSGNNMDRLDDISLTEPLFSPKETLKKSKSEPRPRQTSRPKKTAFHLEKERMTVDTPTSPHAIAAAIFDAALLKKRKKGKSGKASSLGSGGPTSPYGLASFSDSYTSVNEVHNRARSATPSGFLSDDNSPTDSGKNSPKYQNNYKDSYDNSSKKTNKESTKTGWSFFKRFGLTVGNDELYEDKPTTNNENSIFYYDNLTSLRASKQNHNGRETELFAEKAPGYVGSKKSVLSPDSAEFVPASQRVSKAVGSSLRKDTSWATVDDSALERLRPPPGLTRRAPSDIWGLEDIVSNKRTDDRWNKSSIFDGPGYGSLLSGPPGTKSLLDRFDLLGSSGSVRDGIPSLWGSNDELTDAWSPSNIRPSIWDAPDVLMPHTSSAVNTPRSRLGLGLDLKPVSDIVGNDVGDSPLDPFSIWANVDSPYEGWNQDIRD